MPRARKIFRLLNLKGGPREASLCLSLLLSRFQKFAIVCRQVHRAHRPMRLPLKNLRILRPLLGSLPTQHLVEKTQRVLTRLHWSGGRRDDNRCWCQLRS